MGFFEGLGIFSMSSAYAKHSAFIQEVSARNVSRADQPNYLADKVGKFSDLVNDADFRTVLSANGQNNPGTTVVDVFSRQSNEFMKPNGNSVSLQEEFFNSSLAQRQHRRAVTIYKASLDMLRGALAR